VHSSCRCKRAMRLACSTSAQRSGADLASLSSFFRTVLRPKTTYLSVHADAVMQSLEAWNCICNCYLPRSSDRGHGRSAAKQTFNKMWTTILHVYCTYLPHREHERRTSQNLRNYCLSSAAPSFGRSLREEKHSSKRNRSLTDDSRIPYNAE
jgi:hypothetical protein